MTGEGGPAKSRGTITAGVLVGVGAVAAFVIASDTGVEWSLLAALYAIGALVGWVSCRVHYRIDDDADTRDQRRREARDWLKGAIVALRHGVELDRVLHLLATAHRALWEAERERNADWSDDGGLGDALGDDDRSA